jgi:hypothetical protein
VFSLNTFFFPDNYSTCIRVLIFTVCGSPAPQSQHGGQPQAGSPSTPDPGAGINRWVRGGRDWRRGDPNLVNRLWKSKTPLGKTRQHITWQCDKAGVYKYRASCRVATKYCRMAPNIYGYSEWKLLPVRLLAPRILRWFLDFLRICSPLL